MNKKGFTTIELVLTIMIVLIIMATITSVTYTYRDRGKYEGQKSEVINYKNNITKIIYDDILNPYDRVVSISGVGSEYTFTTESGTKYNLRTITKSDEQENKIVGIAYGVENDENEENNEDDEDNKIKYWFPISNAKVKSNLVFDENNNYYRLSIVFSSRNLENDLNLHFVVT